MFVKLLSISYSVFSGLFLLHLKQSWVGWGGSVCKLLAASLRTWFCIPSTYKKAGYGGTLLWSWGGGKIGGSQGLGGHPLLLKWWVIGLVIDCVLKCMLESNRGRHPSVNLWLTHLLTHLHGSMLLHCWTATTKKFHKYRLLHNLHCRLFAVC